MIDTHCHLLPQLDDGPTTEPGAIRMARRLIGFGVRAVICTPHFSRRYPISVAAATERHDALRQALTSLGIELETHLAAEIGPELALTVPPEELTSRALPSGFAIVELVSATPASFVPALLQRFAELQLRPVLAHPERCLAVQKRPALLDEARLDGALVQIVGPSLFGPSPSGISATAWGLIDSGRADLLASDAHREHSSRVQLGPIGDLVQQRYGAAALEALTVTNPLRLLRPRAQ
jgi:protein-tyrosine phosphatase